MKIVRYRSSGRPFVGVAASKGIVDLSSQGAEFDDIGAILYAASSKRLVDIVRSAKSFLDPNDIELLPPLASEARVFCVGLNYHDHVAETKHDLPAVPSIFMRTHQSVVGHKGTIIRPVCSEQLDFEGELAVIIGREGRNIKVEEAISYIGGYSCFNDGSIRDYQRQSTTVGKNFDASGAFGPYIVTTDEIPDLSKLTLTTRLNGDEVQKSSFSSMIFSVPQIVSYASRFTMLRPGDVISTGTPAGIGSRRTPPLWLKPGDILEVDILNIGILKVTVAESQ